MCQQIAHTFLNRLYTVSISALEGKVLVTLYGPPKKAIGIEFLEKNPLLDLY